MQHPRRFLASGWNIGIKDNTLDFGVIHSEIPCAAAGVFTRNNFPGHPVVIGREHLKTGTAQTIVVNSKNANVATGPDGKRIAEAVCRAAAEALGIPVTSVIPSSTGVIGRPMPEEKVLSAAAAIPSHLKSNDFELFSRAIMTTDTRPKLKNAVLANGVRITGVAKGAGMIEPNMATMLSYIVTDARTDSDSLRRLVKAVADRTFNRISVDSDTSTSDTFIMLANGAAEISISFSEKAAEVYNNLENPFEEGVLDSSMTMLDSDSLEFLKAVSLIAKDLALEIVMDGEGATKLIELRVCKARDREQAVRIGRSIINSPLVKTAVYGADPNWGRLVMAVGKSFDDPVPEDGFDILFADRSLKNADPESLHFMSEYLKQKKVDITVILGTGQAAETLWGCDLTEEYIHINAHYTT